MIANRMTDTEARHHEKMVLGCMMLDNAQVPQILKTMTSAWFRVVKHRFIFEAIQTVHRAYAKVTVMSVGTALMEKKQLGIVGGVKYLAEIIGYVTKAAQAHHDAAIRQGVKEAGGNVDRERRE